jgi:ribose 5-phosphate isomerase A
LGAFLPYTPAMDVEALKRAASARALDFVQPGMRLGLGTGSTARHFVDLLGERVAAGLDIIAVPTSEATRTQAEQLGIKLTTLEETPELDLTVDGADEVSPDLTLIKGGGGALLREKIVATASVRMIVIVDESQIRAGARPLSAAHRDRAVRGGGNPSGRRCRHRGGRLLGSGKLA